MRTHKDRKKRLKIPKG